MSKEHPRPWKAVQSKNGWFISDANDTSVVEAAWVAQDPHMGYCLLDEATAKAIVHSYNKCPEAIKLLREASDTLNEYANGVDRFTNDPTASRINKFLELTEEVEI